jgi:hypothetical protein
MVSANFGMLISKSTSSEEWLAVSKFRSIGATTAGIMLLLFSLSTTAIGGAEVFDKLGRERFDNPEPAAKPAPAPAAPAVVQPAPQAPAAPAKPAAAAPATQPNIKPQGCVGFYEALCKETPECTWVTNAKNKDGTPAPPLCKKKVTAAAKPKPKPKPPAPAPAAAEAPAAPAAAAAAPETPQAAPAPPAPPAPSPGPAAPNPADAPIEFPAQ